MINAHDPHTTLAVGDEHEARVVAWHGTYGFAKVAGHAGELFLSARNLLNIDRLRCGDRVKLEVRMDGQGRLYGDNVMLLETKEPR